MAFAMSCHSALLHSALLHTTFTFIDTHTMSTHGRFLCFCLIAFAIGTDDRCGKRSQSRKLRYALAKKKIIRIFRSEMKYGPCVSSRVTFRIQFGYKVKVKWRKTSNETMKFKRDKNDRHSLLNTFTSVNHCRPHSAYPELSYGTIRMRGVLYVCVPFCSGPTTRVRHLQFIE